MLFFGPAPEELPYFRPLGDLPKDFVDIDFGFGQARRVGRSTTCRT